MMRVYRAVFVFLCASASEAGTLADLMEQVASASTLRVEAKVEVLVEPAALTSPAGCGPTGIGVPGEGDFFLDASGPMWRQSSRMDPAAMPGVDVDAAWNGQFLQILDRSTRTMGLFNNAASVPGWPCLQNPLAALVEFLDPVTDANEGTVVTPPDMRSLASNASLANIQWMQDPLTRSLVYADFPGGVYEGLVYSIRVTAAASETSRIARIELIGSAGRVLARSVFSGWAPADNDPQGSSRWPRTIAFDLFDPDSGAPVTHLTYRITSLSVNHEGPAASAFTIPLSAAARVFINSPEALIQP